jgi:hypothetical protein
MIENSYIAALCARVAAHNAIEAKKVAEADAARQKALDAARDYIWQMGLTDAAR